MRLTGLALIVGLTTAPAGFAAACQGTEVLFEDTFETLEPTWGGADDALLVGSSGQLLEGATSSVFVVTRGAVLTPPLSLGILPGITRERLMAAAQRAGIETRESLLTVHDAYRAQELIVTSSVRGIVPVVAVDGIPIGTGQPGPVCASLQKAFAAQLPGA